MDGRLGYVAWVGWMVCLCYWRACVVGVSGVVTWVDVVIIAIVITIMLS